MAPGAAEAEQIDGKAGKMTDTGARRRCPGLLARGAAKPAPCGALRTRGSCRLRRGHGPYGHPIRGSEAQTGAALSGDTQRPCDNTTQRLLGEVLALPHHLGHCTITFCTTTRAERTKDLQPNLPGRGRRPSLRLFPTQQPTKVLGWLAQEQPPLLAAAPFPILSPHPAGTPLRRGAATATSAHPAPAPREHHPEGAN